MLCTVVCVSFHRSRDTSKQFSLLSDDWWYTPHCESNRIYFSGIIGQNHIRYCTGKTIFLFFSFNYFSLVLLDTASIWMLWWKQGKWFFTPRSVNQTYAEKNIRSYTIESLSISISLSLAHSRIGRWYTSRPIYISLLSHYMHYMYIFAEAMHTRTHSHSLIWIHTTETNNNRNGKQEQTHIHTQSQDDVWYRFFDEQKKTKCCRKQKIVEAKYDSPFFGISL